MRYQTARLHFNRINDITELSALVHGVFPVKVTAVVRPPTQSCNPVATAEAVRRAMFDDMTTTEIEAMKLGAQQTLDELFAGSLIPFKLSARVVESIGMEEYIVRFHDSRLYSIDVSWRRGQTFKPIFRTAILDRVARLTIPPRLARTA